MLNDIITQSRLLPRVENFFIGKDLPENFSVPTSVLLYCHDFDLRQTIISSRYMLVIPFTDFTYRIENHQYHLQCGQAILINPYLHRSVSSPQHNSLRLIISFTLSGAQDYLPKNPVMTINDSSWNLIDLLLKNYKRGEIISIMFSLTLLLKELTQHTIKTESRETSPCIRKALHPVNQYIEQSFSIKDIAAQVGLSPSHLRRRFRDEVGISFGKYLNNIRLNAAKRLLVDTRLRIEEVGSNCGYDTIYSFSRFFKKNAGISPLHFRKKHTKKDLSLKP